MTDTYVLPTSKQAQHVSGQEFLSKVYLWIMIEFLVAGISGFFIGPLVASQAVFLALSIGLFAFLVVASFLIRKYPAMATVMAIAVPGVLGIFLYSVVSLYIAAGMTNLVVLAILGTALIFGSTAVIAYRSKRSLESAVPVLFGVVVGLFILSLVNVLWLKLAFVHFLIACVALVVFTLFSYVDVQRVIKRSRGQDDGIMLPPQYYAVSIFIDIYNIFVSLLEILGYASNR